MHQSISWVVQRTVETAPNQANPLVLEAEPDQLCVPWFQSGLLLPFQ